MLVRRNSEKVNNLDRDLFDQMLNTTEDDHHDFKQAWYHPGQKLEMVKDIFSFVNTVHEDDCFLIIGVTNSLEIIGVENDITNRLNQQKVIDFLRSLPIAGQFIPEIEVETINYDVHEIDVIKIVNTKNVPCFLSESWCEKGTKNFIRPGQIFYREKDVNTSKTSTATYDESKKLWQKHFRISAPIQERYKYILEDWENWSYIDNDGSCFVYNLDPDFYMKVVDDNLERSKIEGYSFDQMNPLIGWDLLKLKYRQITVFEFSVCWLDGGKILVKAPSLGYLKGSITDNLTYFYFVRDSIQFKVQELFNYGLPLEPDRFSQSNFFDTLAVYKSETERLEVEEYASEYGEKIRELIVPSEKEISSLQSKSRRIPKNDPDRSDTAVRAIIMDNKLGKLMNKILKDYENEKEFTFFDEL